MSKLLLLKKCCCDNGEYYISPATYTNHKLYRFEMTPLITKVWVKQYRDYNGQNPYYYVAFSQAERDAIPSGLLYPYSELLYYQHYYLSKEELRTVIYDGTAGVTPPPEDVTVISSDPYPSLDSGDIINYCYTDSAIRTQITNYDADSPIMNLTNSIIIKAKNSGTSNIYLVYYTGNEATINTKLNTWGTILPEGQEFKRYNGSSWVTAYWAKNTHAPDVYADTEQFRVYYVAGSIGQFIVLNASKDLIMI